MGRKSKKYSTERLIAEEIETSIPIEDVGPKQLLYVTLSKFSKMYRATFKDQFDAKLVSKIGNYKIGDREFELGKTYEVVRTPEVDKALRERIFMASGKYHYKGEQPK